jgi:hypothetical protein
VQYKLVTLERKAQGFFEGFFLRAFDTKRWRLTIVHF